MKKLVILMLCLTFSVLTFNVSAQETKVNEEYKTELMKYFKATGSDAAIAVSLESFIAMMPNVNEEKKKESFKILMDKVMTLMVEAMSPVYEKHISLADLKELNKFYETPFGKRLTTSVIAISKDVIPVAQEMNKKIQGIIQEFMTQIN